MGFLSGNRVKHFTGLLLLGLAVYTAMYGVTYAYRLHHLVNALAAWLVGVHFSRVKVTKQVLMEVFLDDGEEEEGRKKRHQ